MDHAGEIAARMDTVRERRGISVAELARRAGIDGKRLWYILRGNRAMSSSDYARCLIWKYIIS